MLVLEKFHNINLRGAPLYTEVSSFQGVGIEEFHCIQRCPHIHGVVTKCVKRIPLI